MSSVRVLVVDDHSIVREGLRSLLDAEPDIKVVGEAEDGNAAISEARQHQPDVVLMDVSMPRMNGIEATRRVVTELPSVRVVGLSLHADPHLVSQMLEAGAMGYVVKSAPVEEVTTAVRTVATSQMYLSPAVAGYVVRDYVTTRVANKAREPRLTARELEVLQLIAEGHGTGEIAGRLFISAKTVSTHRENIMKKLDLFSVVALTKYAIRNGLTTAEPDL